MSETVPHPLPGSAPNPAPQYPPPATGARWKPVLSSPWLWGALLIALPVLVPILTVAGSLLLPADAAWEHLRATVLPGYLGNTLALLGLVAVLTLVLGVSCAWLIASFEFRGSATLQWALVLPLAAPSYVVAYVYADLLEPGGPLQLAISGWFGLPNAPLPLPPLRSLGGAAIMLGLTLYPYVYLLALNGFAQQTTGYRDAARMLGLGPWARWWRVTLPMARPAVIGGLALALMETAADYGVVEYFGVPTLTSGIFRTWYALGEHRAATQLAGWLFLVVTLLVVVELYARRGARNNPTNGSSAAQRQPLSPLKGLAAAGWCALPVTLGFVIPLLLLCWHAVTVGDPLPAPAFLRFIGNTLGVAALGATLAVLAALWLAYAERLQPLPALRLTSRVATLGYALPGMVLAVGMLGPLTELDKGLADLYHAVTGEPGRLILTGSIVALVFVYVARFLTAAYNAINSGLQSLSPELDAASRSLGVGALATLRRVHLPLLLPVVSSAGLLVFIDIIKELPATLILRPFNFETLATRTYRLAADERVPEAATAALIIVALSLLPTLFLGLRSRRVQGV